MNMRVIEIPAYITHEWLLHKHYAKRIPSIQRAFGLYDSLNILQGVCTYGTPCKLMNDGMCIFDNDLKIATYELNRLVINEPHEANALSFFVGQSIKLMPKPACLVSYSDIGENHHGYIYQATNWLYTGMTDQTGGYTYYFNDDWQHPRTTVALFGTREHSVIIRKFPTIEFKRVSRKHRYFYFIGNSFQIREMKTKLKYPILPYPKGDNQRYDATYQTTAQGLLL